MKDQNDKHKYRKALPWLAAAGIVIAVCGYLIDLIGVKDLGIEVYILGLGVAFASLYLRFSLAMADEQHEYELKRDAEFNQLLTDIRDRLNH